MRKIGFSPYKGRTKEILPKTCKANEWETQRIVYIYTHESLLFHQFFRRSRDAKVQYMTKGVFFNPEFRMLLGYAHPAAELIQLMFNGKEVRMMLDLNILFTQTVYHRIKCEADKKVTLDAPYIHIDQHGVRTRIYPRWKHVDPKNLEKRDRDIDGGFLRLKSEEIDQCYLVYPKTERFRRHITVKNGASEHLKMIPYSFTFCTRERKRCKKQDYSMQVQQEIRNTLPTKSSQRWVQPR